MFASIGEPTSQVISIPTSSEDEINQHDASDYEQGAVEEEEEEETDKQIEAIGLSTPNPNIQGIRHLNDLVERLEFLIQKLVMMDYMMKC